MTTLRAAFRVTICGIPELETHCASGVTHVLSILDPDWPDPPAFGVFPPHRRLALRFHDVIEPLDRHRPPRREDVEQLLAFGREIGDERVSHLLVHCHAGVSRSTAATALVLAQADPALPATAVFETVARIRPRAWPNLRILEFGDALLRRNGEIVGAAASVYRRLLDRDPTLAQIMIDSGRGREVSAALANAAG